VFVAVCIVSSVVLFCCSGLLGYRNAFVNFVFRLACQLDSQRSKTSEAWWTVTQSFVWVLPHLRACSDIRNDAWLVSCVLDSMPYNFPLCLTSEKLIKAHLLHLKGWVWTWKQDSPQERGGDHERLQWPGHSNTGMWAWQPLTIVCYAQLLIELICCSFTNPFFCCHGVEIKESSALFFVFVHLPFPFFIRLPLTMCVIATSILFGRSSSPSHSISA